METKKGLKKLSLDKEEIVNLNDQEKGDVIGGTGWGCSIATIIASVSFTYDITKDVSWWVNDCEIKQPSQKVVNDTPHQRCEIDEVVVVGINTQN